MNNETATELLERLLSTPGVTSVEFEVNPEETLVNEEAKTFKKILIGSYMCTVYFIYETVDTDDDPFRPKPIMNWGSSLQESLQHAWDAVEYLSGSLEVEEDV